MARGAMADTRRQADLERQRANQRIDQGYGERAAVRGSLLPQYEELARNPISEEERNARRAGSFGPLGASFDAAQQGAERHVAQTRNPAGYYETLDELARERGRQTADLGYKTEAGLGDTAFRRRMVALGGMGNLYGVDTQLLERELGLPFDYLKIRAAMSPGSSGILGRSISAGGGIAAAGIIA